MKISRWMLAAGMAAVVTAVALAGSLGVAKAPAAAKAQFKAALVSDVAGFNDNGFNKNQLVGLKKETKSLGGQYYALVSHSSSDYTPNYNTAVHVDHANIVIAAGFLLSGTMKTFAHNNPGTKFAITDDTASDAGGYKNEEGITYATQEGGCLVGVLAAKMAQSKGTNVIKIQHAQVVFQVAGLCGDGALTKAASDGKWGIGVDADEYNVAPGHILTSALKKTDVGVETAIADAANGWHGGKNILLNLKNNGVGVGKINPAANGWVSLMNSYKSKILRKIITPPAACKPHPACN